MTKRKTYTAKFSDGEVIRRQTVTARVYVRLRTKPFGAVRLWVFRRCSVFRLSGTNDGRFILGRWVLRAAFGQIAEENLKIFAEKISSGAAAIAHRGPERFTG
jgi:hypothetical protein